MVFRMFRRRPGPSDVPGHGPSISAWIRQRLDPKTGQLDDTTLPDEGDPNPNEVRFAAGAWEGVVTHHMGSSTGEAPSELRPVVEAALRRGTVRTYRECYRAANTAHLLTEADAVLDAVWELDAQARWELGRWLAEHGRNRGPVKLGIALLGTVAGTDDERLLFDLGSHDEFTLYALVALANRAEDDEDAEERTWTLAQRARGWGRVHAVERLAASRPEIQDWLVREGFRNGVMNEYLALIAAERGGLLERLGTPDPDEALVDGARDIVLALMGEGPAGDIDDYADAGDLLDRLLLHVAARPSRVKDLALAHDLVHWLEDEDEDWDERSSRGVTPERRSLLLDRCHAMQSRAEWGPIIERALDDRAGDDHHAAWTAATRLRWNLWPRSWAALQANPRDPSAWARCSIENGCFVHGSLADRTRAQRLVAFAEKTLPLDEIARGPSSAIGMGPEWSLDGCVQPVLEVLARHPGLGWNVIRPALRSAVVRTRVVAARAIAAWPVENRPPDCADVLATALEAEPKETVRAILERARSGDPPASGT